jgi:hypothetical protein
MYVSACFKDSCVGSECNLSPASLEIQAIGDWAFLSGYRGPGVWSLKNFATILHSRIFSAQLIQTSAPAAAKSVYRADLVPPNDNLRKHQRRSYGLLGLLPETRTGRPAHNSSPLLRHLPPIFSVGSKRQIDVDQSAGELNEFRLWSLADKLSRPKIRLCPLLVQKRTNVSAV